MLPQGVGSLMEAVAALNQVTLVQPSVSCSQLLSGCQLPQLQQMSKQIDAALLPGSAAVVVGLSLLKVVNWVGCGRRENLYIFLYTYVYIIIYICTCIYIYMHTFMCHVYRYLLIFGAQAVPGIHSVLKQCHEYIWIESRTS